MKKAPQLQVKHKNNIVIAGLGVDSWRERAISEVRGLRDERGLNVVGNLHTAIQRPPGQARGGQGEENDTVIARLFFFFVIPRLDRGICKGDVRFKAEHDKEKTPLLRGFSANQGNSGDQAGSEASAGVTIIRSLYPVKSIEYSLTGALLREFPLSWRKYINTRPFGDQVGPSTR